MTTEQLKGMLVKEICDIADRVEELNTRNSAEPEEIAAQLRECAHALEVSWET